MNVSAMWPLGTASRRVIQSTLVLFALAVVDIGQAADTITYYHHDNLGSPVLATDESGAVKWREIYTPYGSRLLYESRELDCTPLPCDQVDSHWDEKQFYTGKLDESRIGLNYFGARWYDPSIGRFLSVDPVEFSQGNIFSFNRYAYTNNNPYRYVDPDGRETIAIRQLNSNIRAFGQGKISEAQFKARTRAQTTGMLAGAGIAATIYAGATGGGAALTLGTLAGENGVVLPGPPLKGLITPKKFFGSKNKGEVTRALKSKFGEPRSSRENAQTFYNERTKRSFNVHDDPNHNNGKPHVDIRQRGSTKERKFNLKQD